MTTKYRNGKPGPMGQLILFPGVERVEFPQLTASNDNDQRNDIRTGRSGEMLVLAKLLRWKFDAHDAPQEAPYDLIVDVRGRIVRIQVKTRSKPVAANWPFKAIRGNHRSPTGTYSYIDGDFDIFAGVANSIEKVLFVPTVIGSITFRTEEFMAEHSELNSWEWALNEVLTRNNGGNAA